MLIKIPFWFTIVTLLSFNVQEIDNATKKITVSGKAQNAKDGAIVVMKDETYFLDGVPRWPDQYYDKQVKVSGKLKIVTSEKPGADSITHAVWFGTRKYIKNPKWNLIE